MPAPNHSSSILEVRHATTMLTIALFSFSITTDAIVVMLSVSKKPITMVVK